VEDATADLIGEARGGSREAFGRLAELHWSRMVRLARSVVGDSEAEDAVQDALIAAWLALGGLKEPGMFTAWLGRIVVRKCLKRARRMPADRLLVPVPDAAGPGNPAARLEVQEILSKLAPRQRAVLHLSVAEGMTDTEIAGLLSMRPATVRAHRRRAREKVERLMTSGRER